MAISKEIDHNQQQRGPNKPNKLGHVKFRKKNDEMKFKRK